MEKIICYIRSVCLLVMAISFAAIAYSQYESMKVQRVQAIAAIMGRDNYVQTLARVTAFDLLNGGFSIKEVYEYLYQSESLVELARKNGK